MRIQARARERLWAGLGVGGEEAGGATSEEAVAVAAGTRKQAGSVSGSEEVSAIFLNQSLTPEP